jgi:hypothetical protein
MGNKERDLINNRLLNLKKNERLFRINSGMGWVGKEIHIKNNCIIRLKKGDLIIRNPSALHAAPEGWPDLCGWTEIEITPDMIGKKIAIFTAEEIKATGHLSKKQKIFRDIIQKMGGIFRVIKN